VRVCVACAYVSLLINKCYIDLKQINLTGMCVLFSYLSLLCNYVIHY